MGPNNATLFAVAAGFVHLSKRKDTFSAFSAVAMTACYTAHFVHLERSIGSSMLKTLLRSFYAPLQMLRISLPWWVAAGKKLFGVSGSGSIRKSMHE